MNVFLNLSVGNVKPPNYSHVLCVQVCAQPVLSSPFFIERLTRFVY